MTGWWTTPGTVVNMGAVARQRRSMVERLKVASPGVVLASIGVVVFAVRLSQADDPVGITGSLLWGVATVVLVRLVLGVLGADHVGLTVLGAGIGLFELLMLVTSDPDNPYSRVGLMILGLLDLGLTSAVWLAILVSPFWSVVLVKAFRRSTDTEAVVTEKSSGDGRSEGK
jgi:hypothetical protein